MLDAILFEYAPGDYLTQLAATFTRATTARYQTKPRNIAAPGNPLSPLALAASGALRDAHYQNGILVPTTLLEKATTNLLLQSELNGTWVDNTNATHTPAAATGADNGLTAAQVNFTNNVNNDVTQTITVATPANKRYIFSFWVSDGTLTWLGDNLAISLSRGDNTNRSILTKSGGGLIATGEVMFTKEGFTFRKVYAIYAADATTSANVKVWFQNNLANGNYFVWGAMLEDVTGTTKNKPSSTVNTAAATVTRNDDILNFVYNAPPQQMWVYSKHIEMGNNASGGLTALWAIGGATGCLQVINGGAQYFMEYWNNGVQVGLTGGPNLPTPNFGDTVELFLILNLDGTGSIRQSINGGAESTPQTFVGSSPASVWASQIIRLCADRGGTVRGYGAFQSFRIGAGNNVSTLAQARMPSAHISFTDTIGQAVLENRKPYPADRFVSWNPDSVPIGSSAARLSDEQTFMFRVSDRRSVSFSLPGLSSRRIYANIDGSTPMDIATRLIYYMGNGGTCLVRTGDSQGNAYSPCAIVPGTKPTLNISDKRLMEYTLSIQLVNVNPTTKDFVLQYS